MARDIVHIRKKKILSFGLLASETTVFEGGCHILLYGGERPHIGCTVMAQPRPSLADPQKMSSTASVLNLSGHKDETVSYTHLDVYKRQVRLCYHNFVKIAAGGIPV